MSRYFAVIAAVMLLPGCGSSSDSAGPSDAGADASQCSLSCKGSLESYCAQNPCIETWPSDPQMLCELGPGWRFYACATDYVASSLNVDVSTTFTYDKATSSLSSVTGYNANSQTSTCYADSAKVEFSCAGDDTCTELTVDCTDSGGSTDGAAGDAGFSGAGGK